MVHPGAVAGTGAWRLSVGCSYSRSAASASLSARSIFSTVAMLGACVPPRSMRQSDSGRMPARRARSACNCHLNGLALVDGKLEYVTALGETNEMGGGRANKARGGIVMDVDSSEILCRGLSMPHSPRWHGGRLWLGESGSGTLGTVDLNTGRYEAVAAVPGFTRGLDFLGDLAFVGLSQVRESAVFSGIPITERLTPEQRTCGVCVVDLSRGATVALLKFTSGVQEMFAVALLPLSTSGLRSPLFGDGLSGKCVSDFR